MNRLFNIKSENNKQLINIASVILEEKKITSNIKLHNYNIEAKASKNEVTLKLTRLVKFIPLRHKHISNFDYNLHVNLIEKTKQFFFLLKKILLHPN